MSSLPNKTRLNALLTPENIQKYREYMGIRGEDTIPQLRTMHQLLSDAHAIGVNLSGTEVDPVQMDPPLDEIEDLISWLDDVLNPTPEALLDTEGAVLISDELWDELGLPRSRG